MEEYIEYAEEDGDIVCAAVSTLALNFFNSIGTFTEDEFEDRAGQENMQFRFCFTSEINPEPKLLMNSPILGLRNIEENYGKSYINVKCKEV